MTPVRVVEPAAFDVVAVLPYFMCIPWIKSTWGPLFGSQICRVGGSGGGTSTEVLVQ